MEPNKKSNIFIIRASAAETWTTVAEPNKKSNIFIFRLRCTFLCFVVIFQKGFDTIRKLERKIVLDAAGEDVAKRASLARSASGSVAIPRCINQRPRCYAGIYIALTHAFHPPLPRFRRR